jgi:hypothetical protein
MYKPIFCTAQNINQTAIIVNKLKTAGFSNNEISVLFQDTSGSNELDIKAQHKAQDRVTGGIDVVAELEWIVEIDSLEIPDIGPFIAAGPILIELSRIPEKGTLGGLMGALIGVGIPEHDAQHYQEKIKGGRTLIAVNTGNMEARDTANNIFQQAHAEDISSS